jgi:hypothetical protein
MLDPEASNTFVFQESTDVFTGKGKPYSEKTLQFVFSIFDDGEKQKYFEIIHSLSNEEKRKEFQARLTHSLATSITMLLSTHVPGYFYVKTEYSPGQTNGWHFESDKLAVLFDLPIPQTKSDYLALVQRCLLIIENPEVMGEVVGRVRMGMELVGRNAGLLSLSGFMMLPKTRSEWEAMQLLKKKLSEIE